MDVIADLITAIFIVAVVYVLVRPQSAAVDLVTTFSNAVAALVQTAVDL